MTAATPGICRFCNKALGACTLPDGEPCAWFDHKRTACSNPACVSAYFEARDKAGFEAFRNRPKKRTPAEVHQIKVEERRKKRREYRARRKGRVA